MEIVVNPSAELPIYRQIMRQIVEAIAAERLRGGDKLASHRELSEQLVVAPLTVKKAYDELEALGYIETQRGRGTFICEKRPKVDRSAQRERIEEAARNLLSLAYLGGFRLSDIVKVIKELDRELTSESRERENV
jgi:GntR family transcriptional regulator